MKNYALLAFSCVFAFHANARTVALPEWMFGMEIASLCSTGQWVNVKHSDWAKVKVVRADDCATGRVEKVVFVSRDLSDIWGDEEEMRKFRQRSMTPSFFYCGVGSSTATRYASGSGGKKGSVRSSSGLAGDFHFRERADGTKTFRISIRPMTDREWKTWTDFHGELPPPEPMATVFPAKLLGIDLPPVAPQDAKLLEVKSSCSSSEYGENKFKKWRESPVPTGDSLFPTRENEYSWKTKTLVSVSFRRTVPASLTAEERKAIVDELLRRIEADGFKLQGVAYEKDEDSAGEPWNIDISASRPDGLRLFTFVLNGMSSGGGPGLRKSDDDVLSLSINLHGDMSPESKIWQEGRCN